MNAEVVWTDLQPSAIVEKLAAQGYSITENTVRAALKKEFRKRKPSKVMAIGCCDPQDRDDQFEKIKSLRKQYETKGWPVLSVDTKKRSFSAGSTGTANSTAWMQIPLKRFDHDFADLAEGQAHPPRHRRRRCNIQWHSITLGTRPTTLGFVAERIRGWWNYRGRYDYPGCQRLLLLMDGGGANSHRVHQFKREMIKLATWTGLEIRIAHYPPYCSKWNPIEHRLFPCHSKSAGRFSRQCRDDEILYQREGKYHHRTDHQGLHTRQDGSNMMM